MEPTNSLPKWFLISIVAIVAVTAIVILYRNKRKTVVLQDSTGIDTTVIDQINSLQNPLV